MNEMKKTVISAVAVLLAVVVACGWIYMGWADCKKAETVLAQKKAHVITLREKINRIPKLREEKNKLQEELAEYETILPNDQELDKIFDTLSDFTRDSGVNILEFRPEAEMVNGPEQASSSYRKVTYSLKLAGDFFQVTKFVNLLENYKRFVRVDSFDMGKTKLDAPLGDTSLQISTFVYDPKAVPAPAPNALAGGSVAEPIPFVLVSERGKQFLYEGPVNTGSLADRDPFTNPLTKVHPETQDRARIASGPKRLLPPQEKELVQNVETQLATISDLVKDGDFEKAADVFADVETKMAYQFKDASIETQVAAARARLSEIGELLKTGRGKKLLELVSAQCDKMKEAFKVADYEGVAKIYLAQADMIARAERVDYEGLKALTTEAKALAERARVCADFARLEVNVQGVITSHSGRSAAIINGQNVIEGDKLKSDPALKGKKIDDDSDVFVHSITRDKITFRYKGERVDKMLVQ